MKILVTAKQVIDPYVNIKIKDDGSGVDDKKTKLSINPFDEIAIEQAVQLKEQGNAHEVIVVSIGNKDVQKALRGALALGADRAIHIETNQALSSLNIAKILHKITCQELPNLVLLGKQSIDGDNSQVGPMLAALLDWPQACFASNIALQEGTSCQVTCELDGGLRTVAMSLPAIITTDLRLNKPRLPSLPNIMRANAKPLISFPLDTLNLVLKKEIEILQVSKPLPRKKVTMVKDVQELVEKLRQDTKTAL